MNFFATTAAYVSREKVLFQFSQYGPKLIRFRLCLNDNQAGDPYIILGGADRVNVMSLLVGIPQEKKVFRCC